MGKQQGKVIFIPDNHPDYIWAWKMTGSGQTVICKILDKDEIYKILKKSGELNV